MQIDRKKGEHIGKVQLFPSAVDMIVPGNPKELMTKLTHINQ